MSTPPIIFGLGGVVAGMVIGVAIGGSIVEDKINAAVTGAMQGAQETAGEASAATEEALAALGDRMTALETQVSESAPSMSGISDTVQTRLDEMQQALSSRMDEVSESAGQGASELRAAMQEMHDTIRARMQDRTGSGGQGSSGSSTSSNMETQEEGAGSEAAAGSDGGSQGSGSEDQASQSGIPNIGEDAPQQQVAVGETALFAEGAVRAFVSRLDAEGGSARISVNGVLVPLAVGEAASVAHPGGECAIQFNGVESGKATLASDCDELVQALSEDQGQEQSAGEAAEGSGEQYSPGQTVQLAEGLRVFISGMLQDPSSARIAVNGLRTQIVPTGESVEVETGSQICTVTVTGVGDGFVSLAANCS